jgi:hypothetical protein
MIGDVVHSEHRKHFPDCPFIQQCYQNPQPIMSPQSINQSDNIQDFNFGYQNTTNQNSEAPPSSRNVWMETSQPQTPADKPGVTRPNCIACPMIYGF